MNAKTKKIDVADDDPGAAAPLVKRSAPALVAPQDLSRVNPDDAWLAAYPEHHRELLRHHGVADRVHPRARAFNLGLVEVAEAGFVDEAFLDRAETLFLRHFGDLVIAPIAVDPASRLPEGGASRHVEMSADAQVSVGHAINFARERFLAREVQFIIGATINHKGDVRPFVGGYSAHPDAVRMFGHAVAQGEPFAKASPTPGDAKVIIDSPVFTATDEREKQQAVSRVVRDVRRRYREQDIEMIAGFTINRRGFVTPFGGGEMDRAVMIEAAQYLRQWLEEKGEVRPGPELH